MHCSDLQIQELDEELSTLRHQTLEQAQQIDVKDAEISSLKSQLATWRAVKEAEAASLSSSNKQLADQFAKEIARSRTLESQLTRSQTEWVSRCLSNNLMIQKATAGAYLHIHITTCRAARMKGLEQLDNSQQVLLKINLATFMLAERHQGPTSAAATATCPSQAAGRLSSIC